MSAKVDTAIWLALRARLKTVSLSGWPVALPGEVFRPPNPPAPFLRVGRVTAAPERMLIAPGKPHARIGAMMVTVVAPFGQDPAVYDQWAATVAEHFRDGVAMRAHGVCVAVSSYPAVNPGYEDEGWWNVPVRIPWICYA